MNHSLEDDNKDFKNASKEQNPSASRQDKLNQLLKVFLFVHCLPGMPLENTYTSYKGMENIFMVPQVCLFLINHPLILTN